MKSCIRFLLLLTAVTAACAGHASADSVYIGSSDKTTAVKAFEGAFDVVKEPNTNSIAVTKDGILIISPGGQGVMTVSEGDVQNVVSVVPASVFDFEDESAQEEHIQFSGERKEDEDGGFYSDGGVMDVSKLKITKDSMNVSFRINKADTETSDIIMLSAGEETIAKVSLNKRSDELVYLSYLNGDKTERLRNVTYNVGQWYDIEASIDLTARRMKLCIDKEEVLTAPIAECEQLTGINFGTYVDDISVLSGYIVDEGGIEIGAEDAKIPPEGIFKIDPMIKVKLNDEFHEIDARYVSFRTDKTGIMPSGGMIAAEGKCDVEISAGAIISGTEYKAQKTITLTDDAEEGELLDTLGVFEPVLEEGKIKLRIVNGEGMNLKVIVCRTDEGGALDYTFSDWVPETADEGFEIEAADENTVVYLTDTASRANLLEKEGV